MIGELDVLELELCFDVGWYCGVGCGVICG